MVSIVANFYNSARYIPKLMKSVSSQTFTDWELVCVNDYSPGNDSEVINATARKLGISDKVILIENPCNLGIARAKKVAIDAARGEYITFIDGDDWLAPEALMRMVSPMTEHGLDMVVINHFRYITPFYKIEHKSSPEPEDWGKPIDRKRFQSLYLMNFLAENRYGVAYWGKMFRSSLLKDLDFDYPDAEHSVREDFLFNMAVARRVSRMMFVDYAGYYWRYGGITTGLRKNDDWGLCRYITQNAEMYAPRKALAEEFGITEGLVPLRAQLKNLLVWSISRMARYAPGDKRSYPLRDFIKQTISMPAYSEVAALLDHNPSPENRRIIDMISRGDADALYAFCHDTYKRAWKGRAAKSAFRIVLTPFLRLV